MGCSSGSDEMTDGPPMRAHRDQRDSDRFTIVTICWYSIVGDSSPAHEGLARSCDFSSTGVGIVTPRPVDQGARVFLEVASNRGQVSIVCAVAFCRKDEDDCYRVGLRLEIVPPSDLPTLKKLQRA